MADRDGRQWLRERRRAHDLTQEALAQLVGCAPATIRRIEAGARRPSRQVAELLARALVIAPEEHALFIAQLRGIAPAAVSEAPALSRRDAPERTGIALQPTLPLQPRPFIGRVRELNILAALLAESDTRVVTIVAPGGMGKTRLALTVLEYAQGAPRFAKGKSIWLLACCALGRRDLDVAEHNADEAIALLEQVQAMDWVARAHTSAAHVAHLRGRPGRAWAHIALALHLSLRHRSYMALMFALRPAALLTADTGAIEQAIELGELARQLTYGRWAEDICYTQLDALAAQLPAEVAAAARERSRQRDPWLVGQELLAGLEANKHTECIP